ncbi:hypothetical protein ABVK25_003965 [Lepraria finkii]|uniref:Secreted protein n=1 Tax=Lepraria finkii TaxID=1340010 RepID=A0ABR4BCZ6_9LECA
MKSRSVAVWKFLTVLGAEILGSFPCYQYVEWGRYRSDAWRFPLPSYECTFNDVANLPSLREFAGNFAGSPLPNSSRKQSGGSFVSGKSQRVFSRHYDTWSTTHSSIILN